MIDRFVNEKSIVAVKVATITSPLLYIIESYIFNDWQFLWAVISLVALDWIWGLYLAWKTKTISKEGFQKGGEKLAQYATLLILGHILLNVKSGGDQMTAFSYFTTMIHGYIIVLEAISILEKQAKINPKFVPKWLLDSLKSFKETGKMKKDSEEK